MESTAFVVLDALGLRSDDYSFPYVALWSGGDADRIKDSAERVIRCAKRILDSFLSGDLEAKEKIA